MYLHIGNGVSIKDGDIIGIFDLDTATVSKNTRNFINSKARTVEYTDTDLPRSFIVTIKNKKEKVILSRISTVGLKMRLDNNDLT